MSHTNSTMLVSQHHLGVRMLSLVILLIASCYVASAADCYGDKGQHPDETWAWTVRQSMCGDNGCALSDAETGSNAECTLSIQIRNRTVARAYRSTTTGKYDSCWDALGNAISQCFRDNSVPYTGAEGKTQGNWQLNGESYWIQIYTDDEFALYDAANEVVLDLETETVDNDPETPGRDYVYGPRNYCMGLSPGGSSCFDIPDGCFILEPTYNYIPEIICG